MISERVNWEELSFNDHGLRPITMMDAPELLRNYSSEIAMKFFDLPVFKELSEAEEQIKRWIERDKKEIGIRWVIFDNNVSKKLIGTIGFHQINKEHRSAELGFDLSVALWNKGIISTVVPIALTLGFQDLKLHRVEARVDPDHIASQRVLEKNGFVKEGRLRENYWNGSEFRDEFVYSILNRS